VDWSGTLTKYGWDSSVVGAEPFHPLGLQAQLARAAGQSVSRVTATVGTSQSYGDVKVSFTVSVECVQQEGAINLAGEVAFLKALELTNDAARFLGIQELEKPQ
jgi:hypothetical protein